MATWLVVFLFALGALVFFVVGMSLTLMIKGHNIDSEIATNKHMRERGITCAAHDAREDKKGDCGKTLCSDRSCATCASSEHA